MAEGIEMFLQQGDAAYEAGDYAKAAEWLSKAAEQGHARAQSDLGYLYTNGWGVPQDHAKAAEWYGKAAEQGHEQAKDYLSKIRVEQ